MGLILGRFAGAAQELHDALLVNPYDVQQVGETIRTAPEIELRRTKTADGNGPLASGKGAQCLSLGVECVDGPMCSAARKQGAGALCVDRSMESFSLVESLFLEIMCMQAPMT